MRAMLLLVGGVALVGGGCSGKGGTGGSAGTSPPAVKKELLAGSWKSVSERLFVAGFDFGADGTLKMRIRGMAQPVPGRYTWTGDRTITVQYQMAEVRKAYQEAAQAYKDQVKKDVENKKLYDKAAPSLLASVREELPAEERFQVSITEKPRTLILVKDGGASLQFE